MIFSCFKCEERHQLAGKGVCCVLLGVFSCFKEMASEEKNCNIHKCNRGLSVEFIAIDQINVEHGGNL
jgi:hypothetical protein